MRVLVVEDERSLAVGVKRALEAEGYEVDIALHGDEGFALASTDRYALIILDVMLPGRNGYVICRSLRAAGNRTPIIMLTAKSGEWDVVEGLDLGADDYLIKPFSMPVLLARVRVRTRSVGSTVDTLALGGLRCDAAVRLCWRDDVEIELTGREATLLQQLLRHAGEVVTKADLLRLVWGESFAGDPNVVEVYVLRLRRKIDAPFGTADIETVRGVGYRLRTPTPASPASPT
jgi:two-component system OmpR family response regulator